MPDFGTDLAGVLDIDANLSTVSGELGVAQAIARRLTTPRGGLFYDPDYGYDLRRLLNDLALPAGAIAFHVEAEALKDERVETARARVTVAGETLTVALQLTTAQGPFVMSLAVSALTVDLFVRRQ